jgi:hypothetical protein
MTATREAITLPLMFLTVAGLGGLRVGHTVALIPPPLVSLVLALMLVGALVRAGVFAPHSLLNAGRSSLENLSGLTVLIALVAASAQVFTLVTPERGLLHAIFSICFFVQLATTLAGVNGRRNLLRSLVVLLGAAFVIRFIVLEALYAADGGLAKRLLTTLLEGASLGSLQYEPVGATTGYIAFFVLVLYFIAIILLPPAEPPDALTVLPIEESPSILPVVLVVLAVACSGCRDWTSTDTRAEEGVAADAATVARVREDALATARVWSPPAVPVAQFDFAANPPHGFERSDEVSCRFTVRKLSGATPKFHCALPDGRILKIKYGRRNAELEAEVAGTRLLRALGFSADDMFTVRAVHCAGCPRLPFQSLKCVDRVGSEFLCFAGPLDYNSVRTFRSAVIEQRLDGGIVEGFDDQGWAWYELDRIDAARGGATRAEVDALRLMAVFLSHWDNKAPNQRLLCPPGRELSRGGCAAPIAMIQDLGATFGPLSVDLPNWRATPIWHDRAACIVSMRTLPYRGATFSDVRISDAGRRLIAGLLDQLSTAQLEDLFTASGMIQYDAIDGHARAATGWVEAFRDKVRQIRDGAPCPQ